MENEDEYTMSFCLSFSCYTNDQIAETAERVRFEFSDESNDEFEFINLQPNYDFVFDKDESSLPQTIVTTQLRDLFLRKDRSYSSSSSDEEELDVISSDIHCPGTPEKSLNGGWRKSKSTGSSASSTSWRISDLLKRSYSEVKKYLKFLNWSSRNRDEFTKEKEKEKVCAYEKFYMRNRAMKEEEKRRSFLPYKQHVFGFFLE